MNNIAGIEGANVYNVYHLFMMALLLRMICGGISVPMQWFMLLLVQ